MDWFIYNYTYIYIFITNNIFPQSGAAPFSRHQVFPAYAAQLFWAFGVGSFGTWDELDGNAWITQMIQIWGWINTYFFTIFSRMNIQLNQLHFDVNYRGTIGFDTLPYENDQKNENAS